MPSAEVARPDPVEGASQVRYTHMGSEGRDMTSLTVGQKGEIALPDAVRERYGLLPQTQVRMIETRTGILLVPLTDAPMSAELAQELADWQALSAESWDMFPYEDEEA